MTSANSSFHSLSSVINDLIANSTGGKYDKNNDNNVVPDLQGTASSLSSQVQNIITGFTNVTDDFLGENGIVNTINTSLAAVVGDDGSLLKYNNIRYTLLLIVIVIKTCSEKEQLLELLV